MPVPKMSVLERVDRYFLISFLTFEDKWYNPELHFISNKIIYGQLSTKAWQVRLMNLQITQGKLLFYINITTAWW